MNREEFANLLMQSLKRYHADSVKSSMIRNLHMSACDPKSIRDASDDVLDAVLVDFVNYVCSRQGIDLALYTKDLKP